MSGRRIEPLQPDEVAQAAFLWSQAYSPLPIIIAVFGEPSEKQRSLLENGFKMAFEKMPGEVFAAKEDDEIVGVMRIVEWPQCQKSPLQGLYFIPALLLLRGKALRIRKWNSIWGRHDPKKPHWHLNGLGVLPEKQGQGIGSMLLEFMCMYVDELRQGTYLETDVPRNVGLYERFGFNVVAEEPVLSVPNWFMWRPPSTE